MYKNYKYVKEILKEDEAIPITVVNTSVITNEKLPHSRMVPILFLDTTERIDVREAIINHKFVETGDASSVWTIKNSRDYKNIYLLIEIKNPTNCKFLIHFDILEFGSVIDLIINKNVCYLQSSLDGINVKESFDACRILVEIPSKEFKDMWDRIYLNSITKTLMKKNKISKKQASKQAKEAISKMRKIITEI